MKRRLALLLLVGLWARPAAATILPDWDLAALVTRAKAVVVGRIDTAVTVVEGGRVMTEYRVTVERTLLGPARSEVVVTQLGGEVDGIVTEVLGTAALARGKRYLLILSRGADGRLYPVGMALGVYALDGERLFQRLEVPLARPGGWTRPPMARESTLVEVEQVLRDARR